MRFEPETLPLLQPTLPSITSITSDSPLKVNEGQQTRPSPPALPQHQDQQAVTELSGTTIQQSQSPNQTDGAESAESPKPAVVVELMDPNSEVVRTEALKTIRIMLRHGYLGIVGWF